MPIIRVDGRAVGHADVSDETVNKMYLDEDWNLGLKPGWHEMKIELEPVLKKKEDGGIDVVFRHLSHKFEILPGLRDRLKLDDEGLI